MSNFYKQCLIVVAVFTFAGCGGGGGGGADTTKPIITILGNNPMDVIKGTTFTDPGATAKDNVDGNITDQIIKVANVNTSVVGHYSVKYSVKDKANNKADDKTRVVNVYVPAVFQFTSNSTPELTECQGNEIVTLSTKDSGGSVIFKMISNNSNGSIILTGNKLEFNSSKPADYETKFEYDITVTATDSNGDEISQDIRVKVKQWSVLFNNHTYGCVKSPYTGKVWLDRNIGANRICTSVTDIECYGDYFQWGRNADGHESNTSESNDTLATRIHPVQDAIKGKFVKTDIGTNDWIDTHNTGDNNDTNGSKRMANWQTDNNTSTVCPDEYYVATDDDIAYELFEDNNSAQIDKNSSEVAGNSDNRLENAVNSFMKIPANGKKEKSNSIDNNGSEANLWTSYSEYDGFDLEPSSLFIEPDSGEVDLFEAPVYGMAIRCIKK